MKITVRRRCRWFRFGLASLIPPCCVLRFACHRGDDRQALQRGRTYSRRAEFVPCLVFHSWDDSPAVIAREVAGLNLTARQSEAIDRLITDSPPVYTRPSRAI